MWQQAVLWPNNLMRVLGSRLDTGQLRAAQVGRQCCCWMGPAEKAAVPWLGAASQGARGLVVRLGKPSDPFIGQGPHELGPSVAVHCELSSHQAPACSSRRTSREAGWGGATPQLASGRSSSRPFRPPLPPQPPGWRAAQRTVCHSALQTARRNCRPGPAARALLPQDVPLSHWERAYARLNLRPDQLDLLGMLHGEYLQTVRATGERQREATARLQWVGRAGRGGAGREVWW